MCGKKKRFCRPVSSAAAARGYRRYLTLRCDQKQAGVQNDPADRGRDDLPRTVSALCEAAVKALGLDGNIGFDLRERRDGTPFILECNPRITAGVPYFALAGVNLPYLCVKKLLGEELPKSQLEYGKIIKRRWMEM